MTLKICFLPQIPPPKDHNNNKGFGSQMMKDGRHITAVPIHVPTEEGMMGVPTREKSKRATKRPSKYLGYMPPVENRPRGDKVRKSCKHRLYL